MAAQLQLRGAHVQVHDPRANATAAAVFPTLRYADSAQECLRGADLVLHLTEWAQFRELDPNDLAGLVARRVIVDARNALDAFRWRAAGWRYRALGRPPQRSVAFASI